MCNDFEKALSICVRLVREARFSDALEILNKAIERFPDSDKLFFERGKLHLNLGDHEKAYDDFSNASNLSESNSTYIEHKGVSRSSLGNHGQAIRDLQAALKLNPDALSINLQLCLCHLFVGEIDRATEFADTAVRLDTKDPYANYCLGTCRMAADRVYSACKLFEAALNIDPSHNLFWTAHCKACLKMGDLERALVSGGRAAELNPSAMSYIVIAQICIEAEDSIGAKANLEKAREFELTKVESLLVGGFENIAIRQSQNR